MTEQLLDGLFLYEITLLILGALLFLVLIVLLTVKVATRQPIKVLIPFFIIPILMIGFPGIEQFNFMNGMAELKTKIKRAIEEPDNTELLAEINEDLSALSRRPVSAPDNLIVLGEAYEVLRQPEEAKRIAGTVRERQPDHDAAIQLQHRIDLRENLGRVQENPQDIQARTDLQRNISALEAAPQRDTRSLYSIARAHMALGDTSTAEALADTITVQRPQFDARTFLRRELVLPDT
jgi:hypothetical protein